MVGRFGLTLGMLNGVEDGKRRLNMDSTTGSVAYKVMKRKYGASEDERYDRQPSPALIAEREGQTS